MIAERAVQTNVNFAIWNQGLYYGELLIEIHRQDSIQKNKKKSRGRKDYNSPLTVKTANKARFIALCIQGTSDVSSFATIRPTALLKRMDSNPLDSNHQHNRKTLIGEQAGQFTVTLRSIIVSAEYTYTTKTLNFCVN